MYEVIKHVMKREELKYSSKQWNSLCGNSQDLSDLVKSEDPRATTGKSWAGLESVMKRIELL
jgi:hypothetical protein